MVDIEPGIRSLQIESAEANNGDRIRVVEKNHVVNCEDANPKEVDSSDKTEEVKDNEVTAAAEVVKEEHNQKRHLNVVFIGHVDSGKSTMGGQILLLSGQVDDRTIQKCEKEARDKSRGNGHMAYIMDTNEEERDKGVTIDVGRADFETETVRFTILDAPGHKGFVPNMISGASKADIGVLVISARKGEFETGYERGGQTREHVQLAKTLGVSKLLVAVNKMDDPTVKWSKDRYDAIRSELITFIKSSGYNAKKDVQFLPLSGLVGLNMKERIDKSVCPWWSGPCLLEALDGIGAEIPLRDPKGPFRMPISSKFTDTGAFVTGKVESGSVTKGDALLLMPNKTQVKVLEVYIDENKVKHAEPGENLSIKLSGIDDEEIPKGFVLSSVERPIGAVTEFVAQLQILGPKFISAGYHAVLHIHLAIENCMVVELLHEINPKTKQPMRREIRCAKNGAFVVCRIRVNKLICIEKFSDFPQLGRFTLRYYDETVAVGKVMELPSSGSIF
ncbi:GTP binding Elongation factor Tu family protein [Euphorbia peplus]|nr:GTP binding Elongation factor Tu family protein [Euphorbia peplus]